MTSAENRDIHNGLEILNALVGLLGDPSTIAKLRKLQGEAQKAIKAEEKATRAKEAHRGTCKECGRMYGINKDQTIRRHGKGKCMDRQLPREIIPAILAIAQLGADRGEATSDDTGD